MLADQLVGIQGRRVGSEHHDSARGRRHRGLQGQRARDSARDHSLCGVHARSVSSSGEHASLVSPGAPEDPLTPEKIHSRLRHTIFWRLDFVLRW